MSRVLSKPFFARPTLTVARDLLGKYLVRKVGKKVLSGKIIEVEAYVGEDDLACHASRGRTKRSEGLYAEPGTLYVYLVYGMYWCLNIVTERKDFPSAVLIRAVEPVEGVEMMMRNRNLLIHDRHPGPDPGSIRSASRRIADLDPGFRRNDIAKITNGPGKLCEAFGITGSLHGKLLGPKTLWIEDRGMRIPKSSISTSSRIGVAYAKHCAKYPWRLLLKSPNSKS